MKLLTSGILLILVISFSCGKTEISSDKQRFSGIWTYSTISFDQANLSIEAIAFKNDYSWFRGKFINTNFIISDGEFGKWKLNSDKKILFTLDFSLSTFTNPSSSFLFLRG